MKKSTRIVKKLLALFLVVLMSINTLGAVVSDNDGSAFITKAEFDSLKNNFQSQIDQYNTSIDSKIDGAIASYLSGIKISKTQELVPEFAGTRLLASNIDKINNLKFGKMDFKINAAMINILKEIWNNGFAADARGSSGAGIVLLERIDATGKHGEGFEVFRNTRDNKCRYYDDLRFEWTASKFDAARQSSGWSKPGDQIFLRWHGWYGGQQSTCGTANTHNIDGRYHSDILANDTWLGLHQSAGIGIVTTSWLDGRGDGLMHNYQTSVSAYDLGNKYIISTNGTDGIESGVICNFTKDEWSTDLISQEEKLYDKYDVATYKYALPTDAGLTTNQCASFTINDWAYYNNSASYHNAAIIPTYLIGSTWTRYGTYNSSPPFDTTRVTADDFYEMCPRISTTSVATLKNEVALTDVRGTYTDWDGYLYEGLPLYNFSSEGTIKLEFDLSDTTRVKEDLYLVVSDEPLKDNLKASDYLNKNLGTHINSYKVNGVSTDKSCAILPSGDIVKVDVEINSKTNIYYKLVPVNANSKERNIVIMPSTFKFEVAN